MIVVLVRGWVKGNWETLRAYLANEEPINESRHPNPGSNVSIEVVEGEGSGLPASVRGIANDDPVRLSAGEGGRCQSAKRTG